MKLKTAILALAMLAGASSTATKAKACPAIGAGENENGTYFLTYQCSGQNAYDVQVSYWRWDVYVTLGY